LWVSSSSCKRAEREETGWRCCCDYSHQNAAAHEQPTLFSRWGHVSESCIVNMFTNWKRALVSSSNSLTSFVLVHSSFMRVVARYASSISQWPAASLGYRCSSQLVAAAFLMYEWSQLAHVVLFNSSLKVYINIYFPRQDHCPKMNHPSWAGPCSVLTWLQLPSKLCRLLFTPCSSAACALHVHAAIVLGELFSGFCVCIKSLCR
jgi:hypothetical protein